MILPSLLKRKGSLSFPCILTSVKGQFLVEILRTFDGTPHTLKVEKAIAQFPWEPVVNEVPRSSEIL